MCPCAGQYSSSRDHASLASSLEQPGEALRSSHKVRNVRKLSEDLDSSQLNKWIPSSHALEVLCKQQQVAQLRSRAEGHSTTHCPYVLPPKAPQHRDCPTLVLDMDETLVHASSSVPRRHCSRSFVIPCSHGGSVHVAVRPGVTTFLAIMAEYFEIVLFTAATQVRTPAAPTRRWSLPHSTYPSRWQQLARKSSAALLACLELAQLLVMMHGAVDAWADNAWHDPGRGADRAQRMCRSMQSR